MTRTGLLLLVTALLIGAAAGVGTFTFAYAKGSSYLTEDPAACANCHVMQAQYDGWIKSSHRTAATCNDCHTPHGIVGKYATKARNGLLHSTYFTLGGFPEPIRITSAGRAVTEGACRSCHEAIVTAIDPRGAPSHGQESCLRCHTSVGHWTR